MNTKVTTIRMLTLLFAFFFLAMKADAQTYQLTVSNETLVNSSTYQFDVYIKRTGATDLELANVGFGLGFDVSTTNGGTLTFSIVSPGATFCDLLPAQQPSSVTLGTAAQTTVVGGVTYRYMNVNARTNPGAGSGTHISSTGTCPALGSRIGRFQLSNTVAFTSNSSFKHLFSTAIGAGRNNTVVSAYVGTTATVITSAASNLGYNAAGTCDLNPTLNFTCPTITLSPAAGALAGGTIATPYAGATITATGGVAPYSYAITGGSLPAGLTLSTGGVISGTPTGPAGLASFTVTATDASVGLCPGSAAYTINIVNGCNVSGSATTTAVTCFGGSDGTAQVTLTGTGAGAPGTYSLDGGPATPYSTNPFTVSGLSAGAHSVVATVTGGGCVSSSIGFTVSGPSAALAGTGTTTAVTCFGGTDGSATITVTGGNTQSPGTYSLDGGPATPYSTNPFTISGLTAGSHNVVVSAGGCTTSAIPVTVGGPSAALAGSGTTTAVSCFGGSDGTATITVTGGSTQSPGTYTLDAGLPQPYNTNPFTITGLTAGSHSVVVTAGGCSTSAIPVSVGSVAVLAGSGTTTPVSCFGSTNGTATITVTGGNTQIGTYSLDNGPATPYATNPFTITGLSGGSHSVVVSAGGCTSAAIPVTVSSPAVFAGTGTTTPKTCGGGNNGTATITLTGGSTQAPGTYSLDGGPATPYSTNPFTITGLSAGNHSIVATAGSCTTAAILVNVGSAGTFTATFTATNISACNAGNDGTITVTPVGGSGNYNYAWTGVTGSGNPATTPFPNPGNVSSLTGLPIGYYNVTITDLGGCGTVTLTNIHISLAFTVYVTNSGTSSSSCGNTGTVVLYGNAGVAPYTYSLTAAAGPYQASNTFTGLAAGSYTAYVKDAAGCVGTKSVTVSAAAAIVVSPFARAASSCAPDGSIEVYKTGGIPPFTYSKDGTNYQASNVFTGLAAGPYTVYAKDASGCVGQANTTVAAGVGLSATTSKVNTSTCINDGSIQVTASGGVAPYTYSKDNGATYQAANSFGGLSAGPYAIKVKDSKGCTSGTINVTINLNTIVVTASATAATTCTSNNGTIQLFRTGGYGPYTYSLDGNTYQPGTTFTNLPAGTYTGFVKDSKTCIGSVSNIVVGPVGCPPGIVSTKGNVNVKALPVVASEMKIQAYPNPSTTEFTLVLEGYDATAKVSITITDVLGRKVYQTEGTGKQQYKIGKGFFAGIYNVQVIQGTDKKSLKLVKE